MSRKIKPVIPILGVTGVLVIVGFAWIFHQSIGMQDQQQEKPKQAEAKAATELPPEQKAFYSTYGITEPEIRIEALEKFINDFPESSQIDSAKREIFKATIKVWPADKEKMFESANRLLGDAEMNGITRSSNNQFIARELFSAGIFLDEAETFALKSLDGINKPEFIEKQKKQYVEWKRPMPAEDVMNRKYISEFAAYQATLGRICLKRRKTAEGERILKAAFSLDPLTAHAAIGLAEIAEGRGENAAALDYLMTATFTSGHSMADARGRLEMLYRKTHNASIDALESKLDARYKELFPNPIKVDRYRPTATRSNRTVLAEFFTGAG